MGLFINTVYICVPRELRKMMDSLEMLLIGVKRLESLLRSFLVYLRMSPLNEGRS